MPYKDPERAKEYKRKYHLANRERHLANMRAHRLAHPEYMRDYRMVNKEKIRKQRQIHRQQEKESISAYQKAYHKLHPNYHKEYREANIDRVRPQEQARYQANIEHHKKLNKLWSIKNRDKRNSYYAMRYARKLKATPCWLSKKQKKEIVAWYSLAQATNLVVDHVIPLKGKSVCGLHVPWNLQLLTRSENASKSNRLIT